VQSDILRRNHVNRIPRANLGAMLTADAAVKVDITPRLNACKFFARHLVYAFNRANFNTRFTAGATIGMNHGHDLRNNLSRLSCKRFSGH
jgi:hypothetical protein